MKKGWLILIAAMLVCSIPAQSRTLTYVDLVNSIIDLEALSVLPEPGEVGAQASSYDRASEYDEATGRYLHWDANADGHGVIRMEDGKYVLAEIDGPGVIWRMWSATPLGGNVRVYLDGSDEPAIDMPFRDYFNKLHEPFTYPALVYSSALGWNNYVPIPFQKSCKIVADYEWGHYYHFTYGQFPEGTTVPTFKRDLSTREKMALARVNNYLENFLGNDPVMRRPGQITERNRVSVGPGASATVADVVGPRAITALRVSMRDLSPEDAEAVLRETLLKITWDDNKSPAVWSPLGDFFGTAPGINYYKSLTLGMTPDEFYSLWYMPFDSRAKVEIVNESKQRVVADFTVTHAPLNRSIDDLGRFHARWHRGPFPPPEPERKAIDWTMLVTEGRGRYAGVALEVWNPRGGWWGEGDEKFHVDGEKFPSTFGTGSEDYFGYAWCSPELFNRALHNQTRNDGDNIGHISVNRWHVADNVPFQTQFEGYIEKYFPDHLPTHYAATVYWYLEPGGVDPYPTVPVAERTSWYTPAEIFRVKDALEGEDMERIEWTGGGITTQGMTIFGQEWSNGFHLWWQGPAVGDRLVLGLPVERAGRYEIRAQMTKANDYGIVQLSVNGEKLGGPIDLYSPHVVPTGEISLGEVNLERGKNRLEVEIVGKNEQAIASHMFGLDYIRLVRK